MLLDSWAWLELARGGPAAARVERVLLEVPVTYTCPIVVAEVYSAVARRVDDASARRQVAGIVEESTMVLHDEAQGLAAGALHAELRRTRKDFGMDDALVLAAARSREVKVLTGDPHFAGLPDAEMLGG